MDGSNHPSCCLAHCLERTGHVVTAIDQVTVFQGQFDILGNMPSYPSIVAAAPFIHPNLLYLLKGQLLGLVSELEHQLPDCQGVSVPYELGCGKE